VKENFVLFFGGFELCDWRESMGSERIFLFIVAACRDFLFCSNFISLFPLFFFLSKHTHITYIYIKLVFY
jgi:hypothetical protein